MADDNCDWVVVKHSRFPFADDVVIGRYPDEASALKACNDAMLHAQWFCSYGVEKRIKGG